MNGWRGAVIGVALGLTAAAHSDEGGITISSPAEGSKLPNNSTKVVFEVTPAPKVDHVIVFVDGEQVASVRQLKGSYGVDKLPTGKHWLCVRVVDKGNTPVGIEKCVGVVAGNVPPMGY